MTDEYYINCADCGKSVSILESKPDGFGQLRCAGCDKAMAEYYDQKQYEALKNSWSVGAGFDLVQGEWMEDSYATEKVWYVEAVNEYGDRYYWQGVRDEAHALRLEMVANAQLARGEFNILKGAWRLSDNPVYGSQAYVADYSNQEYMRMDEFEQAAARQRGF